MLKKIILLICVLLCTGCATELYVTQKGDWINGYQNYRWSEREIITESPEWNYKFINRKCWYKATGYYSKKKLEVYKLQPLTVKQIDRIANNLYDKKGEIVLIDRLDFNIYFNEIKEIYQIRDVTNEDDAEDEFRSSFFWSDPYALYPDWSESTWQLIKAGKIVPGMTKDQVELSWGELGREPEDKYVSDNYVKKTYKINNRYLTFINDILDSLYETNY